MGLTYCIDRFAVGGERRILATLFKPFLFFQEEARA